MIKATDRLLGPSAPGDVDEICARRKFPAACQLGANARLVCRDEVDDGSRPGSPRAMRP